MWYQYREKENFVEGILTDILHDTQLENELRIKLRNMGEKEIKHILYMISNQKVKDAYPTNLRGYYNVELKNQIKNEFLNILRKRY